MQNDGIPVGVASGIIIPPENAFASLLPPAASRSNINLESYIKVSNMIADLSKSADVTREEAPSPEQPSNRESNKELLTTQPIILKTELAMIPGDLSDASPSPLIMKRQITAGSDISIEINVANRETQVIEETERESLKPQEDEEWAKAVEDTIVAVEASRPDGVPQLLLN